MPAVSAPSKVLVSGANGYIAVWVVRTLLDRGFSVRGTVRSESKIPHLKKVFKDELEKGLLEVVVVPDITVSGAFDEAVKGVDAIEHTASPFHFKADDPSELIDPAVKGTTGILESATKFGGPQLKRIAITSSCAAVSNPDSTGLLDERSFNEGNIIEIREKGRDATQVGKYRASKSLAEKAAWKYYEDHKSSISWDLVVLNPPFVFGPILHEITSASQLNTSLAGLYDAIFLKTRTPEQLASFQGEWVDVRDVALGHVRAIEVEEAGGSRFILSGGAFIYQDFYDIVNELKISGVDAPKGTPGKGKDFAYTIRYDASKAKNVLGFEFRDKTTTTKDTIEDFKARGWLN